MSHTNLSGVSELTGNLTEAEVPAGRPTGFDIRGFPASTWILNAMYEAPLNYPVATHDELYQQELRAGRRSPRELGDTDLSSMGKVSGWELGWTHQPDSPYERVRWRDYAARTGKPPVLEGRYPDYRGLRPSNSRSSWPSNVQPPGEGSLDVESWLALIPHLSAMSTHGDAEACTAFYSFLGSKDWDESKCIYRGHLRDAEFLTNNGFAGSPQNLWPDDLAWFVYTDWDGWGTRVSGSHALIAAIKSDPALECYDLPHETDAS